MSNSKKQLHEREPEVPGYCRQQGEAPETQLSFTLWYKDGFYYVKWSARENVVRYKNRKRFLSSWRYREALSLGTSAGAE